MLNDRQLNIVNDLEQTDQLITANSLAEKYHVSLRTIRNDIEEIDYSTKKYDMEFLRVPKVGMKIIAKESIYQKLLSDSSISSFSSLSIDQQNYVLALAFLFRPNPITLDFLTDLTQISKVTLNNKLVQCANYLSKYDIRINSVKHKGNYLIGQSKSINDLFIDIARNINFQIFKSFFSKSFLSNQEKEIVDDFINYTANEILFYPTNHDSLVITFCYIIKQTNLYSNDSADYLSNDTVMFLISPNVSNLVQHINLKLNINLCDGYVSLLKQALTEFTDSTSLLRKEYDTSDNLEKAVKYMVQKSLDYYPMIIDDANDLEKNLLMHIYYTINRIKANLENKNPLLSQIKKRFPLVFNNVMEISREFSKHYPLSIDEDECGFINLYYLNYLENAKNKKSIKVILVCNSGVGATKLLSTKIKNNFPAIEIVKTSSYFDLQSNNVDLTDISFIISTIKIPDKINITSVVVSPLMCNEDILKISNLLPNHSTPNRGTYDSENKKRFLANYSNNDDNNVGLLFSEITVLIYQMLGKIYINGIKEQDMANVVGLTSHIFIAIDRWVNHEYIKSTDFERFKSQYPKEMKIILYFLAEMEKLLQIYIDPIEATAILRYFI